MNRVGVGVLAGALGLIVGGGLVLLVLAVLAGTHHGRHEPTVVQYACSEDRRVCLERTTQPPFLDVGHDSRRINVYLMQDDGTPLPRFSYWEDPFHDDPVNIDFSETRIVLTGDTATLVLNAEQYGNIG
ncbi:MAG: hypothetical protein GXX86_13435 [Propionibacterium sp.]|nr:hypothetical protein [Propionibacterium sp.]